MQLSRGLSFHVFLSKTYKQEGRPILKDSRCEGHRAYQTKSLQAAREHGAGRCQSPLAVLLRLRGPAALILGT